MDYVTRQFIFLAKKFRKELRKAQESLHRDLTNLSDRLKDLKRSIHEQGKAYDKRSKVDPGIAVTNLQTQVPINVKTYPQRTKKETVWGFAKGLIEIAVAIAVIAYTVISYQNWLQQIDATNFASRQTEFARKGLNEAIKNFRADERPYMIGETPAFSPGQQLIPNVKIYSNFPYKNIGKTPAINEVTIVRLVPFRPPKATPVAIRKAVRRFLSEELRQMREQESKFQRDALNIPDLRRDTAPGEENFASNTDAVVLTSPEIASLQKGDQTIFLFLVGFTTYRDVFGTHYESQHCWFFMGPNPNLWHKYEAYNTIK